MFASRERYVLYTTGALEKRLLPLMLHYFVIKTSTTVLFLTSESRLNRVISTSMHDGRCIIFFIRIKIRLVLLLISVLPYGRLFGVNCKLPCPLLHVGSFLLQFAVYYSSFKSSINWTFRLLTATVLSSFHFMAL